MSGSNTKQYVYCGTCRHYMSNPSGFNQGYCRASFKLDHKDVVKPTRIYEPCSVKNKWKNCEDHEPLRWWKRVLTPYFGLSMFAIMMTVGLVIFLIGVSP